jgi:hypothetical protein
MASPFGADNEKQASITQASRMPYRYKTPFQPLKQAYNRRGRTNYTMAEKFTAGWDER